jgi:hypothetical protein
MPSATVSLDYRFEANKTQNTVVTVLGEKSTGLAFDGNAVTVKIPLDDMNSILTFAEGNSFTADVESDGYEFPALTFDLSAVLRDIQDSASNNTELDGKLTSTSYALDANGWLAQIPHEAIKTVTPGPITSVWDGNLQSANTVAASTQLDATNGDSELSVAIQNLFEQVLNANRLTPLDAGSVQTKFEPDDKIAIYITFGVNKSRTYKIDTQAGPNVVDDLAATFNFGGQDRTLTTTGITINCDANTTENSGTKVKFLLTAASVGLSAALHTLRDAKVANDAAKAAVDAARADVITAIAAKDGVYANVDSTQEAKTAADEDVTAKTAVLTTKMADAATALAALTTAQDAVDNF